VKNPNAASALLTKLNRAESKRESRILDRILEEAARLPNLQQKGAPVISGHAREITNATGR
jgi:hypothetical protein